MIFSLRNHSTIADNVGKCFGLFDTAGYWVSFLIKDLFEWVYWFTIKNNFCLLQIKSTFEILE